MYVVGWLSGSTLFSINEVTPVYTPGPVSTGMGDRLRAGKPPRFVPISVCNQPLRSTQPSTLCGTENEYTGQSAVTFVGNYCSRWFR